MADIVMKMFTTPGKPNKNKRVISPEVFQKGVEKIHTFHGNGVMYLTDSKLDNDIVGVPPDRIIGTIDFNSSYNKDYVAGKQDTVNVNLRTLDLLPALTNHLYDIRLAYIANPKFKDGQTVTKDVRFMYAYLARKDS